MKEFFGKFGKTIGLIVGAVLIVALLVFVIKNQIDANEKQEALMQSVVEMKKLTDGVVRNQSKYVSKEDLEEFGKDLNLDEIRDDMDDLDAKLIGIAKFLAASQGYWGTNLPSDHSTPNPNQPGPGDPQPAPTDVCPGGLSSWCLAAWAVKYMSEAQTKDLHEPFPGDVNVPIGDVSFKAWQENPWDVRILPRNYYVSSVLGQDREGRHYIYNKFEIESGGEKYPIEIAKAEFQEIFPEAEFSWWNPKFALGVGGGIAFPTSDFTEIGVNAAAHPGLFFSPFSYGKTDVSPDFLFLQLGVGYEIVNRNAHFSITPFSYNLGANTKLINNTYVGPTVGVDTASNPNISLGGTLSVTF